MTKSQDVIAKKLPELLKNLPSQGCLQFCLTEEQKECFEKMRESNLLVAQALEAKFAGQDSQFDQVLENKKIDPLKIEAIWKTAKQYIILWEFVILAEPYLKIFYTEIAASFCQHLEKQSSPQTRFLYWISSKMLKKEYNFISAEDLFIAIVEEEQELILMDSLGLNNSRFSVNQIREILTNLKSYIFFDFKGFTFSFNNTQSKVYKIVDYIKCNQITYGWQEMMFFVCIILWFFNPRSLSQELKNKLKEYYTFIFFEIIPLTLTALKKRDSKTWKKIRSYQWNNGYKIYTTPQSKTLPLTLNESQAKNYKDIEKENEGQKSEIESLKMVIRDQEQKIKELECLQDPYSNDGDAICNFEQDDI